MITIEQIEKVLDEKVRPELAKDGGNIETVSLEDGVYYFRFLGACAGCPSAEISAGSIVKEGLMAELPELKDAVLHQVVSEDLLDFARKILNGEVK